LEERQRQALAAQQHADSLAAQKRQADAAAKQEQQRQAQEAETMKAQKAAAEKDALEAQVQAQRAKQKLQQLEDDQRAAAQAQAEAELQAAQESIAMEDQLREQEQQEALQQHHLNAAEQQRIDNLTAEEVAREIEATESAIASAPPSAPSLEEVGSEYVEDKTRNMRLKLAALKVRQQRAPAAKAQQALAEEQHQKKLRAQASLERARKLLNTQKAQQQVVAVEKKVVDTSAQVELAKKVFDMEITKLKQDPAAAKRAAEFKPEAIVDVAQSAPAAATKRTTRDESEVTTLIENVLEKKMPLEQALAAVPEDVRAETVEKAEKTAGKRKKTKQQEIVVTPAQELITNLSDALRGIAGDKEKQDFAEKAIKAFLRRTRSEDTSAQRKAILHSMMLELQKEIRG